MNSYHTGTRVKCQMTFYADEAETTPADPTTITFKIRVPKGGVTTYVHGVDGALVKTGTGVFYAYWDTDEATDGVGEYLYAFEGTGTVVEAKQGKFRTTDTIFA
jgi:hypothetical protein